LTDPHADPAAFILDNTEAIAPPLVPEIRLRLATKITPIWESTETWLAEAGVPPPFWAFCWPGGQALARYVLDQPETVRGKRVLDLAAGSGVAVIAAARAGAIATANDIDAMAQAAIGLNAALNGVAVSVAAGDLVGAPADGWDVVLAGDVCYEKTPAERITGWLRDLAAAGSLVLLADPGRAYVPTRGLKPVAHYRVPTSRELEDREQRETTIWRLDPSEARRSV